MPNESPDGCDGCHVAVDLEQKQDEVLQQLDELNDDILLLLEEFSEQLKSESRRLVG